LQQRLADRSGAGALRLVGYTVDSDECSTEGLALLLRAGNLRAAAEGLAFTLQAGEREFELAVPLVGSFNVANLLAAIGAAVCCGVELEAACRHAARLVPPPGRMQRVGTEGDAPLVVVDYAHTADAIEQALRALRPQAAARGGRLWIVFGAGGDRDPGKRAPMGAAAAKFADRLVITSDNPRREDPAAIIAAVAAGAAAATAIEAIADRAQAIAAAVAAAAPADVVLIAGKGHEATQDIGGVRRPFSDAAEARRALEARAGVTC
jgi:UDP-N-acetylmuramoyl-L-alanyl-D-glutamate--2,6-diaminopimelate ligase